MNATLKDYGYAAWATLGVLALCSFVEEVVKCSRVAGIAESYLLLALEKLSEKDPKESSRIRCRYFQLAYYRSCHHLDADYGSHNLHC